MYPFFSIITPVYNCQKYIKNCIKSVIRQTYTSWELILVDDGSTDSSGRICDEFCYDSRIKVIHQGNAGALNSRIHGIAVANGEYGLGLDADDYLDENCLEIVKKAIDTSGSDLILFGFRFVGKQRGSVRCSLTPNKEYTQREILKEVIENTNHSLCNKAIRMDIIKQADYFCLKEKLSINLDYAQIISILCNITTGYVINDILYNYRIYGKSISHSCKVQHILDTGLVTKCAMHKLKKNGILDKTLCDALYRSYLKMIGFRLERLFTEKKITKDDCRRIHQCRVYINSRKVESLQTLNKKDYRTLKLFRYKQYWILRMLSMKNL